MPPGIAVRLAMHDGHSAQVEMTQSGHISFDRNLVVGECL